MNKKVIIIGSGLGGLATALRLSTKGYQVEIIEKHHQAGGRLNQVVQDGFTFDMGPSFFSMSYEFKELFDFCGLKNPLQLNELNPLYAVYFEKKKKPFLIYKNLGQLAKEFENIEQNLLPKLEKYLSGAGKLFHDTEDIVIRKNFNSRLDYFLKLTGVPLKHTPKMFRSIWAELGNHFESKEIKIIFSLVAFFLGSTPFETPAVYSLLNYTELIHDGYWNVKGGMYSIVEEIKNILIQRNVKFHFNSEIIKAETDDSVITQLIDKKGRAYEADIFICNADAASFRGQILNREKFSGPKLDAMEWSLAPFTIYLGVKGKCKNLYHHNYFLGNNFKEYADAIFKSSVNPVKPYYYVNVSSKSNADCAPEGCENIFILCPVPDLRYKPDWSDGDQLTKSIVADLSSRIDFDLEENKITQRIMNPIDWQNTFNLYRGSGLGLAHGLNQVGGLRPKNKDEQFDNLFYVGASTVPGTGLPMVVISSKLVTERILNEYAAI